MFSTWVNALMDTSENGLSYLFKGPEEGFDRHKKYVGGVFLHFQLSRIH
jgi:hypothetical protein